MSTHSKLSPADLPGIGQPCQAVFQSSNRSWQMKPEYFSLQENEQQDAHASAGEVAIFCLLGEVAVEVEGQAHHLKPNQFAQISAGSLYKLTASAASVVLLLTLISEQRPIDRSRTHTDDDEDVQEASEESFPASDSPSFNPGT